MSLRHDPGRRLSLQKYAGSCGRFCPEVRALISLMEFVWPDSHPSPGWFTARDGPPAWRNDDSAYPADASSGAERVTQMVRPADRGGVLLAVSGVIGYDGCSAGLHTPQRGTRTREALAEVSVGCCRPPVFRRRESMAMQAAMTATRIGERN